jgi:adenylate cyclase
MTPHRDEIERLLSLLETAVDGVSSMSDEEVQEALAKEEQWSGPSAGEIIGRAVASVSKGQTLRPSNGVVLNLQTLRDLRKARGWTQWDLASEAYVSDNSIQRAESGAAISVVNALNIAEALDIAPAGLTALPGTPAVAVLPFANVYGDPESAVYCEGVPIDVISALTCYPSLSVIARSSSFNYRDKEIGEIGRKLGAMYVLEGEVRRLNTEICITARLIKVDTLLSILDRRYERNLSDANSIFTLQDEIAQAVAVAVVPTISEDERQSARRMQPNNRNAWQAYQAGLSHISATTSEENVFAEKSFRRAIELDPTFPGGYKGMSLVSIHQGITFAERFDRNKLEAAVAWARQALQYDPTDPEARACLANALGILGDHEAAIIEARRVLYRSPHFAFAHGMLGAALTFSGRPQEAISSLLRCITLDPGDAMSPTRMLQLAVAYYFCRDYEGTIDAARRVIRAHPNSLMAYRWLAAALGQCGRRDEAADALHKAEDLSPAARGNFGARVPWMRDEDNAHLLEGLQKAGWIDKEPIAANTNTNS